MDELVKRLRELQAITEHCDEQSCDECENRELCDKHDNKTLSGTYKEAADAIEELMAFARFVAEEVVVDDNEWGNNQNAFPEIACRMLFKLGIVSRDSKMWHYDPPKEGEHESQRLRRMSVL